MAAHHSFKIPFIRTQFPDPGEWLPFLKESYATNRFSNFGPTYASLSAKLSSSFAAQGYSALPATNATSALTAVLLSLESSGDVVLPAFTFPATLQSVLASGRDVRLCDVDPRTWEMSDETLAAAISEGNIAAIVPVRSFGLVRDIAALQNLAVPIGAQLIIDGAASMGSPARSGGFGSKAGEIEIVSLHATKTVPAAEGGVVFAPQDRAVAIRSAFNFGLKVAGGFGDGINAKLDDVRSAIALASLKVASAQFDRRKMIAEFYTRAIEEFSDLVSLPINPGPTPWQCFPILLRDADARVALMQRMAGAGIETRRYYFPSLSLGYSGRFSHRIKVCGAKVSEDLADRMLCLPIYSGMKDEEISQCISAVRRNLQLMELQTVCG